MGSNPIPSATAYDPRPSRGFLFSGGSMTDALRRIDKVRQIRRAIGLTIGAAIYSAGLNLFLIPNHVIDGGVTGISLLIQALTGIPFSVLIVLLNVPFFYMGYKSLGPRLAASSMFAIIVLSLCSSRLEKMMPATNDPFLSTIFGGIIIGLGVGIVIKNGGVDGWHGNRGDLDGQPVVVFCRRNRHVFQLLHPGRRGLRLQLEQRHVFPYRVLHLLAHD